MFNKFIGIGRLVRDMELKFTQSGKAAGNFTLAVDSGYGESKKTDFIKCVAWDKTAENIANMMKKGRLVLVEGSIKTGSYDKDGVKVYTTDIQAVKVVFLDRGSNDNSQTVEDVFFPSQVEDDDSDCPF
jgi:single-strand DNA-binding protein